MNDTNIQGTLDITGDVSIGGNDKFTIDASNGDITTDGRGIFGSDCTITGSLEVSSFIDIEEEYLVVMFLLLNLLRSSQQVVMEPTS